MGYGARPAGLGPALVRDELVALVADELPEPGPCSRWERDYLAHRVTLFRMTEPTPLEDARDLLLWTCRAVSNEAAAGALVEEQLAGRCLDLIGVARMVLRRCNHDSEFAMLGSHPDPELP